MKSIIRCSSRPNKLNTEPEMKQPSTRDWEGTEGAEVDDEAALPDEGDDEAPKPFEPISYRSV